MKYNLKNVEWTIDPIKARKNFEKELREKWLNLSQGKKNEYAKGIIKICKEILGE